MLSLWIRRCTYIFPQWQKATKAVGLLKCQVTLPNQAYSFCISKKLCRRSYLFNASSSPFQAPPRVGNSGPRLCLKHFHKEDIVDTGVKLKKNACPQSTTSIPGASSVTNDMILVSSDGFHIPTNISVIISNFEEYSFRLLLSDLWRKYEDHSARMWCRNNKHISWVNKHWGCVLREAIWKL